MARQADNARPPRPGLLHALWHRKVVVAVSTLAVAGAVLVVSLAEKPRYEATASFLVEPGDDEVTPAEVIELSRSDEVAERTAEAVGGIEPEMVSSNVVVAEQGSDVFTVEASARGEVGAPALAADLANNFTNEFVRYTRRLGDAFGGRAEVVATAETPGSPTSPNSVRNTLLGAVAGLLLGVVAAFAWERLDYRVRSARELDAIVGVPLLGRIPKSEALELGSALRELPAADAEAFQMARVGIRYLDVENEIKSVLLTSPEAGDGKTTVSFGLAASAATTGDRVLVIEADMRQPSLSAVAEPSRVGLSTLLTGAATLADAVNSVEVAAGVEGVSGSVDVLQAGPAPPNPTRLLETEAMAQLLYAVEREYDFVVIDTPPATILPDAIPLFGHVDGVIIVAGLGRDTHDDLLQLRDRLEQVDAPVIGAIANFAEAPDESYFRYIRDHEAAVAEAGTVRLESARERASRRAAPAPRRRPPVERRAPRPATRVASDGPANLNEVTVEELRGLDLSITQARRLVAYRERRGGFDSVDEIDDVPGFPDEVREELKRRLSV